MNKRLFNRTGDDIFAKKIVSKLVALDGMGKQKLGTNSLKRRSSIMSKLLTNQQLQSIPELYAFTILKDPICKFKYF